MLSFRRNLKFLIYYLMRLLLNDKKSEKDTEINSVQVNST